MATLCRVMGFIMLAVMLGTCHAVSSAEATNVTLPSTTTSSSSSTTTTTSTSTSIKAEADVVNVSEKETVVAPTDMPPALSNATSLPPVVDKRVVDKLPSPSPSPSTVGDKEQEGEDKEDKEHKDETDKEKKEKGEPLEVDDMLKNPYIRNETVEDSTPAHPDKDTVTVVDSHVVDSKKTHEEEAAENKTTTGTSQTTRITDQPVSRVFYTESTIATPVMALVVDHSNHDHLSPGKTSPFGQPTATAAILAGVLIGVAVAGYVGLVTWRKFLEKRYGNREMLVNEDDDMHHFEL